MKKILKRGMSLPVQLIIVVIVATFLGEFIPHTLKTLSYTISLSIKEVLVFVLPLIIFSLLFSCMMGLQRASLIFIALLFAAVCVSNMFSTLIAYGVSNVAFGCFSEVSQAASASRGGLEPLWTFVLPKYIPNEVALFSGIFLGALAGILKVKRAVALSDILQKMSTGFLKRILIPIIPVFILGFALHFQHMGVIAQITEDYSKVLAMILTVQLGYIAILFFVGSNFNKREWLAKVRNVLPSGIAGFCAMSSAAAMPLTIQAAEENIGDSEKARAIIPSTVNIHLVGDSLWIPIMALGILGAYGMPMPSLAEYLTFASFFVLAKFAVAAVPGGGIIVMLPILEKYLGFNAEMLSLITALYILFDGFITVANVLGNGAFSILFVKAYNFATAFGWRKMKQKI